MLSFLIFPLAMTGFFVLSEKLMSSKSRWSELATRYRETPSPSLSWRRCVYLETEVKEGNTIYRTSYGNNRLSAHLRVFPQAYVAVDAKGLHLKRMPWHFMHPSIGIPWNAIADVETMAASEYGVRQLARRTGFSPRAIGTRVPGSMGTLINLAGGSMTTVTLVNPRMMLTVPAGSIEGAERFLPRRDAPKPAAPSSRPAESDHRPKAGVRVLSSKT